MLFQVTQCYTEEDFASYYYTSSKILNKQTGRVRYFLKFSLLVSAGTLVVLAGYLLWRSLGAILLIFPVLAAIFADFILLYSAYLLLNSVLSSTAGSAARSLWTGYPQKGEQMTITFEDTEFILSLSRYENHYQYAAISIIMENDSHYFLNLINNTFIMLRKSCFIESDPSAFGPFIGKKRQQALLSAAEGQTKGL